MAAVETFNWQIRVYYEDTDAGGVVYHSQYLNFMERARTEWLRHLGVEQPWLKNELGIIFVVHSMQVSFKKPAFFNDVLEIQNCCTKVNHGSMEFLQTIYRLNQIVLEASIKIACVNASNFKPTVIPAIVKEKMASNK